MGVVHHMKRRQLDNRTLIIKVLGHNDLRFEEILHSVSVSRATLNSHLKQLIEEGKIQKKYSSTKKAVVYTVLPGTLMREVIIHDFVSFIGSRVVRQILEIEMGIRNEIDMKEAFSYGTIELFVEKRYKKKPVSYRKILDILKEEYGEWIEKESKENDDW